MLSKSWGFLHLHPSLAPTTRTLPILSFSYSEPRCFPRSSQTVPVPPADPFGFAFRRAQSLCLLAFHQPSQLERVSPYVSTHRTLRTRKRRRVSSALETPFLSISITASTVIFSPTS